MRLPTRKQQTKKPGTLPKEFLQTVAKLFQEQFDKESGGSSFMSYGALYPNEVILCVSLANPKSLAAASMHLSSDLPKDVSEKPEKVTEKLQVMVDMAASWYAQCFQGGAGLDAVLQEMNELDPSWQEVDWEGDTVFVKINKDNYALEGAASEFLKKAGFEESGDDLLDELDEESGDDEGGSHQIH